MTNPQRAKQTLVEYKTKLDAELTKYFDEYIAKNKKVSPYSELSLKELKDATVRGGKRIRGSLTHYTYTLLGGREMENILQAEMALEINNTYILIADDIMDVSPLRRGASTIHENIKNKVIKDYPENNKDDTHLGYSQAINIALIGAHLTQMILLESGFEDKLKFKALEQINSGNILTAHGQILDIFGEIQKHLSKEDIIRIMELKTSNYTFINPLLFGAELASSDEKTKKMLHQFGLKVGVAFQIQDDILGMFGDQEKLGKPTDSDLKEGKHTLLINHVLSNGTSSQIEVVNFALGNRNLTLEDQSKVREIIIETGALENSKNIAQDYISESQNIFSNAKDDSWDVPSYEYLLGLIQYMIEREV